MSGGWRLLAALEDLGLPTLGMQSITFPAPGVIHVDYLDDMAPDPAPAFATAFGDEYATARSGDRIILGYSYPASARTVNALEGHATGPQLVGGLPAHDASPRPNDPVAPDATPVAANDTCYCEHVIHFVNPRDPAKHRYGATVETVARAEHVGRVCATCADACVSDYIVEWDPCPACAEHPGWAHDDESRRSEPADVCKACLGAGRKGVRR